MKSIILTVLLWWTFFSSNAQRITAEVYIESYKDIAISEMKRTGVPAAITLAQGLLETESGNSELVKKSNNHFGIKCKNTWTGASVSHDDDLRGECFRSYPTAAESYRDHSDFLLKSARYSALFSLEVTDYQAWAYGLKKAGYATNPQYPRILINNIEQYNLQQYTQLALHATPGFDSAGINNEKAQNIPVKSNGTILKNITDSAKESFVNIPEKILVINRSKCVFKKKGTSLLAIATTYNIHLSLLLEYNEQAKDGLLGEDQFIYLQKKLKSGETDFYTVLAGETLYDIAQKNGIALQSLADYNAVVPADKLIAGTKLFLKPGLHIGVEDRPLGIIKLYIVKPQEGLYSIAKKYKVTIRQLKEWNRLSKDELHSGQELIVSK